MAKRPKLVRLDRLLVTRGLASDRDAAQRLIRDGDVRVDGGVVDTVAIQVRPDQALLVGVEDRRWVGRGALKLSGALADLPMDVDGHVAADLGSSTGGFTQVLLERGAQRVYAVDVGRGLLHRSLEVDPRVVVLEGTNVRTLQTLPEPITRMVGDLSFVSLRLVLPAVRRLLAPGGQAVLLVKPQFEAPRSAVADGGTVSGVAREDAITGVVSALEEAGFTVLGRRPSRVAGARSGNVEEFVWIASDTASSPGCAGGGPAC